MEKDGPPSSKEESKVGESNLQRPDTMDSEKFKPPREKKDVNPSASVNDVQSKPIAKRENQARIVSASNGNGEATGVDSSNVSLSVASSEVSIARYYIVLMSLSGQLILILIVDCCSLIVTY